MLPKLSLSCLLTSNPAMLGSVFLYWKLRPLAVGMEAWRRLFGKAEYSSLQRST